ncbi:MAG: hypothetical protein R3C44_03560 [Chloroflexota bacterium]
MSTSAAAIDSEWLPPTAIVNGMAVQPHRALNCPHTQLCRAWACGSFASVCCQTAGDCSV